MTAYAIVVLVLCGVTLGLDILAVFMADDDMGVFALINAVALILAIIAVSMGL